ncbi:MAG: winged helix-turn-helix transcriptional regulator [Candidatus Thorarchaeota archaeon]
MSKSRRDQAVSIRVRLSRDTLKRLDRMAGERGRQKFIEEAVLWRLNKEIPPLVHELAEEVNQLKTRVEHLEGMQSTSLFLGELNEVTKTQVCRDDLDRRILAYLLQHEGASTPELAERLLKDSTKRKTIHVRITKLNERAKEALGKTVLLFEKGEVKGKRGAWWLSDGALIAD